MVVIKAGNTTLPGSGGGEDSDIRFFFTDHIGAFIEIIFNHDIFADYNFLMAALGLALKF